MNSLVWFIVVIIGAVSNVQSQNYCDSSLCSGNSWEHIACGHSGLFANSCPLDRHLIKLTKDHKDTILHTHNYLRNKIAGGKQRGYCSAARMATLTWDDELAYLATLNVLQCKMKHDNCRNTNQYKYAGQNLAWRGQSWAFEDVSSVMINSMLVWYNEYELTDQSVINQCCGYNIHDIGHFTQMVYDRATKIGCAFARYSNQYRTGLFACNYSSGNIKGYKVYKCGRSASGCSKGNNPNYPALCSVNEQINTNQVY